MSCGVGPVSSPPLASGSSMANECAPIVTTWRILRPVSRVTTMLMLCSGGGSRGILNPQQRLQCLQGICLVQRLVGPDPQHARKAHRDAALVPGAAVDAFEAELENEAR